MKEHLRSLELSLIILISTSGIAYASCNSGGSTSGFILSGNEQCSSPVTNISDDYPISLRDTSSLTLTADEVSINTTVWNRHLVESSSGTILNTKSLNVTAGYGKYIRALNLAGEANIKGNLTVNHLVSNGGGAAFESNNSNVYGKTVLNTNLVDLLRLGGKNIFHEDVVGKANSVGSYWNVSSDTIFKKNLEITTENLDAILNTGGKIQIDGNAILTVTNPAKSYRNSDVIDNSNSEIVVLGNTTITLGDNKDSSSGIRNSNGNITLNNITNSSIKGSGSLFLLNDKNINKAGTITVQNIDDKTHSDGTLINVSGMGGNLSINSGNLSSDNSTISLGLSDDKGEAVIDIKNSVFKNRENSIITTTNDNKGDSTVNLTKFNDVNNTYGAHFAEVNSGNLTTNLKDSYLTGNTVKLDTANLTINLFNSTWALGLKEGNLSNFNELNINSDSDVTFNKEKSETMSYQLKGNVTNNGKINLSTNTAGNKLMIGGNYTSNNGSLIFNTELKGDDSLTDKLVINGNTSGTTNVIVNNFKGTGAQTEKGIELITVSGNSDGEFKQSGRIIAGDYDYTLRRGGYKPGTDEKNWYLTSLKTPVVNVLIPEIGSYASNTRASNTLFNMRLHDRLGETQYTDALTGEKKVTSMWMRHIGGHNISEVSQGQLKTKENRYITQIGGDLAQWSGNGDDRYHIGAMAGYARQSSKTRNHLSNHYSKGNTTGYSVGLYGTWYQNNTDKSGLYVDSWMLYNWFNNKVSGEGQSTEKYKSRGLTASVETGYTFKLGEYASSTDNLSSFYLQPKVQVTWEGVKAKSHVDRNDVRIESYGDNNIETRLGLRAYINRHSTLDNGKSRNFEPFIEANWIHNTHNLGIKRNGKSYDIAGNRNIGEIKAGIEGQINNNLNIWGNIAQQIGKHKYQDTQVMLGIKYMF